MRGLTVDSVRKREGYQPPEGDAEVEKAIALAQADPRLRGKLDGLTGGAIQITVPQGKPGYGRRVLEAIFAKEEEGIARYHAIVDLTSEKVLLAGPAVSR
jgi:hypothetical protein